MTFAAAMATATVGLGAGVAQADPGDNLHGSCLEVRDHAGGGWQAPTVDSDGEVTEIPVGWSGQQPIPGGEILHAAFSVRNVCDTPAAFQVWSGHWAVDNGATATVRADVGESIGAPVFLGPGVAPGRLVNHSGTLTKNGELDVALYVGIPAGETDQNYGITPDWFFALEEVEVGPAVPDAPTGLSAGAGSVSTGDPVTISGQAEPGSTVTVSGGGQTCTVTADENGAFSCDLTFGTAGDKVITAIAENEDGPSALSESITVTVTETDDGGGDDGGGSDNGGNEGGGGSGSLDFGSLDFGSLDLFGSLGLK